jgi:hypothetical protein
MDAQQETIRPLARAMRRRIALRKVSPAEATGVIVRVRRGALYRGGGDADYACGACGSLLCIGVRAGMFRSLAFACLCGAVNQVG